jgi:prophage DNA circulation protein
MATWWSDNLLEASLNYVEFPVAARAVKTGRNFARYTYPYRDGQGVEDLGRKVYVFSLTVPLFRGMGDGIYPDKYEQLIAIIEDADLRGEVEYIDPEFGPIQVKLVDYDWQTVAEKQDGGVLTLTLEEVGFEQSLLSDLNRPNLGGATRGVQLAGEIDADIAATGEGVTFSLTDAWNTFERALETGALAADEVAAQLDEVYLVANKAAAFCARDELERWSIFNSIVDFLGAAEEHSDNAADRSAGAALVEVLLPDTMDMFAIAQKYLGDANRAEEVAYANPGNPLAYARGSVVRVPRS